MKHGLSARTVTLNGLAANCEANNLATLRVIKPDEKPNRAQRRAIIKFGKRSSMKQGETA